jgi:hypothetical protein
VPIERRHERRKCPDLGEFLSAERTTVDRQIIPRLTFPTPTEKFVKQEGAKHEGATKDAAGTSDNALAKLTKTTPKPPSKIGRSPQELRAGEYPDYPAVPDPEASVPPEAVGADGYAEGSQERWNAPYIDGGGIYSKPVRSR